jgi:serine/threonine-protein kinase
VGRYALYGEFAHGGMATVHVGRLLGPVGFSRTVAIKKLHPQFAKDPDFVSMFLDEARLAARIRHPNVVSTLDVVALDGELFLVMEYVHGESLARLLRTMRDRKDRVPVRVVAAVMTGVLSGLHAAHEARSEKGEPLGLVHRDMSPQNVMIGADGVARVLDFGIAHAQGRVQTTREGQLKGKLAYVAPEQLERGIVDRRTDVYAAAVTLWETLTGRRLFKADSEFQLVGLIKDMEVPLPSSIVPGLPPLLDDVVMRGLARNPEERFSSARAMAVALETACAVASQRQVGEWIEKTAGEILHERAALVAKIETDTSISHLVPQVEVFSSRPPPPVTPYPSFHPPPAMSAHETGPSAVISQQSIAPPPPQRSRAPVVLALALLFLLLGGIAFLGWTRLRTAPAAAPPPPPATVASETPKPPEPPPPETTSPAPVASSAPPPTQTVARPPPPIQPTVTAPTTKPTASASAKPPAADCNPPYTVDTDGIRHVKPECM